jgi:dTDP-4-amino-4,6-dideoxygalactose transaminase
MKEIPLFKVFMSSAAPKEVEKVLLSGFIGQGPKVEEFESRLNEYFNNPFINTVNSCTSALELAVQMVKTEDCEIITTPLTCTATNLAILSRGAKIKWADVDPNTCNIDLDDVARKITPKTRAIMITHWGGYPTDLDKLKEIQNKALNNFGFTPDIIEDCAHAWGAKYKDKLIGTHGNFACFSFQAIKHLTTGDGGILISPNETLHQRAKLLRWYGLDRNNGKDFRCVQNIKEAGFKWHMNDIAATIGLCNLKHTNELIQKHKDNGQYYNTALQEVPGVRLLENNPKYDSSYWIYTMMVDDRANFTKRMKEKNIMISQVHDRNDKHECLREYKTILPNMDEVAKEMICIPSGWWVTREDREYIADCIKEGW